MAQIHVLESCLAWCGYRSNILTQRPAYSKQVPNLILRSKFSKIAITENIYMLSFDDSLTNQASGFKFHYQNMAQKHH